MDSLLKEQLVMDCLKKIEKKLKIINLRNQMMKFQKVQ